MIAQAIVGDTCPRVEKMPFHLNLMIKDLAGHCLTLCMGVRVTKGALDQTGTEG